MNRRTLGLVISFTQLTRLQAQAASMPSLDRLRNRRRYQMRPCLAISAFNLRQGRSDGQTQVCKIASRKRGSDWLKDGSLPG